MPMNLPVWQFGACCGTTMVVYTPLGWWWLFVRTLLLLSNKRARLGIPPVSHFMHTIYWFGRCIVVGLARDFQRLFWLLLVGQQGRGWLSASNDNGENRKFCEFNGRIKFIAARRERQGRERMTENERV